MLARLRWIPALLWMGLIFYLSSLSSSELPSTLSSFLPFSGDKIAHFLEYALLSGLLFFAITLRQGGARVYVLAFILTLLYAVSDEYHQSFVPGRSPALGDVAMDGLGAGTALLVLALGRPWLARRRRLSSPSPEPKDGPPASGPGSSQK